MNSLRARLVGLLALTGLCIIVIGLPVVLLAIGDAPIPHSIPSLDTVRDFLSRPDDGTVALGAIKAIAWISWAILTTLILVEIVSRVRGLRAPDLPGLRLPQAAARNLVSTAALLIIAAPVTMQAATADSAAASLATTSSVAVQDIAPTLRIPAAAPSKPTADVAREALATQQQAKDAATVEYTVKRGDTLWSLAREHLGSGDRYGEIAALNAGLLSGRPGFLKVGWVLQLPAPETEQQNTPRAETTYTVKEGDTLSDVALDHLGDADLYPQIVKASRATIQPGGVRLTDPDVIDVGWKLTVPASTDTLEQEPPAPQQKPEPETPSTHVTPHDDTPGSDEPTGGAATPPKKQTQPEPVTVPPNTTTDGDTSRSSPRAPAVSEDEALPNSVPWMLAGLTGGGVVLAGSMLLVLRRRRRAQFRSRRPGRTVPVPPPGLASVEKSLATSGATAAPTVEFMDDALRRLASDQTRAGRDMPALAAVELTATAIVLHLSQPYDLALPWQGTPDRLHWSCAMDVDADHLGPLDDDQPAPYPMLATIGASDTGAMWLLNCEELATLTITGDPAKGRDFARYVTAELAMNPWSRDVTVDCVGICGEVPAMNLQRIRFQPTGDVAAEALTDAVAMVDRANEAGADVVTARAAQLGDDTWPSRLLVLDTEQDRASLIELLRLLQDHCGRTATSVVMVGERDNTPGAVIHLSSDGRLSLPHAGLSLVAVGLTSDEAQGCAALLTQSDELNDVAIPPNGDAEDERRSWSNQAGALRPEYTLPRGTPIGEINEPVTSILEGPDENYLNAAATTQEDLDVLAPQVPIRMRTDVEDADPTLDDDLTAWLDDGCDLPRLTLLGPVTARTRGNAVAVAKRKAYYTELLAYLATRTHGATSAQVAEAFGLSPGRVRTDINVLRDWLGVNPRTGAKHLPDANKSVAAKARGVGVYQVDGLVVDRDLFLRLRTRGEARGGADGLADLCRALSLVTGQPFDQLRSGGWAWLYEGDRLDQHMIVAIVDVAHIVTTKALAAVDLDQARASAELASLAAPHDEIPRLDLAAVLDAEGHRHEAERLVEEGICDRSDDGEAPMELAERTEAIIRHRDWLNQAQAS